MSLFWTKTSFFFLNSFPSPRNHLPMTMTKTGKTELLQESPHENIWQRTKKIELDLNQNLEWTFFISFWKLKDVHIN